MHASSTKKPETLSQKQAFFSTIDQLHAQNSSQWRWADCPYFLKTFPQENVISYLNLAPFRQIIHQENEKNIDFLDITLEKSLNFHPNLGWNWHKSWILPDINVKLSELSPTNRQAFAKIFVVKAGLEYSENFFLVDIGVKGPAKTSIQNQIAVFRNLKFSSTSYNNEGLKFHLVIVVFEENEENESLDSSYKIIDSKLSPPIYVDSRKSAREICFKESTFLDMFHPDLLVKPLYKKRRKTNDKKEEFINNSLKGFINYYTAPNIRNKIKHPFFIALKFSACVSLYFNKNFFNYATSGDNVKEILLFLHHYNENLSKIYAKKKKTKIFLNKTAENAYLAIHIKNPNQMIFSKKVSEFLGSFDKRIIKIVVEKQELTEKYVEISDLTQLKLIYKEEFQKMNQEERDDLNYDYLSEKRPPFLEKTESFEPCSKKIKEDSSSQCSETKLKGIQTQFIPEITTLIEISKTALLITKKNKEACLKINPEELFKVVIKPVKTQINESGKSSEKEGSFEKIKETSSLKEEKIVKNMIKIERSEDSKKETEAETNFSHKNQQNLQKMNNGFNNGNNLNSFPGFMENNGMGDMTPSMSFLNPNATNIYANYDYMNHMMGMRNGMTSQYNMEEYRNYVEKMEMFMNNKQKMELFLMNNMFFNK